jgi:hypothetical protein
VQYGRQALSDDAASKHPFLLVWTADMLLSEAYPAGREKGIKASLTEASIDWSISVDQF